MKTSSRCVNAEISKNSSHINARQVILVVFGVVDGHESLLFGLSGVETSGIDPTGVVSFVIAAHEEKVYMHDQRIEENRQFCFISE